MAGLFDPISFNLPMLGDVEAVALVWYMLGTVVIVIIGLIMYALGALEKSLGGGGLPGSGGGSTPVDDSGIDESLYDHESQGGYDHDDGHDSG